MLASAEIAKKANQKKRPTFAKEKIQCGIIPTQETTRSKILMEIHSISMCQCDKNLQETNISHLGKRKIIFKSALVKGDVRFTEGY